jgi:hypothetical protein
MVCFACILAVCLSGCGSKVSVVSLEPTMPAARQGIVVPSSDKRLQADLRSGIGELDACLRTREVSEEAGSEPGDSRRVFERIKAGSSDLYAKWQSVRSNQISAEPLRQIGKNRAAMTAPDSGAELDAEGFAILKKYSAAHANACMHIEYLEARLANATEQGKEALSQELDRARAALKSVDAERDSELQRHLLAVQKERDQRRLLEQAASENSDPPPSVEAKAVDPSDSGLSVPLPTTRQRVLVVNASDMALTRGFVATVRDVRMSTEAAIQEKLAHR